jgi:hypothetical protein
VSRRPPADLRKRGCAGCQGNPLRNTGAGSSTASALGTATPPDLRLRTVGVPKRGGVWVRLPLLIASEYCRRVGVRGNGVCSAVSGSKEGPLFRNVHYSSRTVTNSHRPQQPTDLSAQGPHQVCSACPSALYPYGPVAAVRRGAASTRTPTGNRDESGPKGLLVVPPGLPAYVG